ncbi:toluene monooxygenase [Streptomyces sp. NPDC005202]|uniref:toluene monooxygenase n=1 Tax=Streptomyces sp. NPDC005202 TaxID=3157021 RepID=UPI0033A45C0E
MSATPRKPRQRRTFSAFGDVRRMPSEYEIVTHGQNWTTRQNRNGAFEQNPSSPPNLWFLTYRDKSPLMVDDWEQYRDPDTLTYRAYINLQSDAEAKTGGVLEEYAKANADQKLEPGQVALLASLYTPSRYLVHGFQQIQAYIGYIAPTSYITNAACFATADLLRRLTVIAYRTRELQLAAPSAGFGERERQVWEQDEAWQPARRAVEKALISYDWGEAFTALNLMLAPTLDDVLLRQFGEASREAGDEESWLLSKYLQDDADRRSRWSAALVGFAVRQRPDNEAVLRRWIDRWTPAADDAAAGLGSLLEHCGPAGWTADRVVSQARAARETFHDRLFEKAGEGGGSAAERRGA